MRERESNMDSCFLTSTSISCIKARIFSCPKRNNPRQFLTRKIPSRISVNCSLSDSWTPLDDDSDLFKDWREFRAGLVAGEEAATSEKDSSSWSNPDMVVDYPSSLITTGIKWAHKIHEPETGCLLIASEKLDGVHIFEKTVILVLSVGPSGPIGVILNRPSVKETKSTVLDTAGTFSDKRLFFGGPLDEELFLVSPRNGGDNELCKSGVFRQVMKGLFYGTSESIRLAAEMVKSNLVGSSEIRFFDGYCNWENEQLKAEILGGFWTVVACSSSVLDLGSTVQTHGLWDEVLGLIGPQTGSII